MDCDGFAETGSREFSHWPKAGIKAITAMHVPIIVAIEANIPSVLMNLLSVIDDIATLFPIRFETYLVDESG